MAEKVRFFEGKKYLWDGVQYESEETARAKQREYSERGFDVQVWPEGEAVLLYTRRVVKEVVVDES